MSDPAADRTRTITVQALARVEGEGALTIRLREGRVEEVALRIYEPPRFYEAFLRGRAATEVADITSRICGICPVSVSVSISVPAAACSKLSPRSQRIRT